MKKIVGYLKEYINWIDKRVFVCAVLFTAVAIFVNYQFGLNDKIGSLSYPKEYAAWYFIFLAAFSFAYMLTDILNKKALFKNKKFLTLLLIAPLIFAWKMSYATQFNFTSNEALNNYWNTIMYWPFKLLVIVLALLIVWRIFDRQQPFYGISAKNFNVRPYLAMLLIMIPLIALAATQPDFLTMYPKMKSLSPLGDESNNLFYKLLFQLSYGSDFFGIELFFRGFLILAFAKFCGKDAILPWPFFIAPYILASRWVNAFHRFLEALF